MNGSTQAKCGCLQSVQENFFDTSVTFREDPFFKQAQTAHRRARSALVAFNTCLIYRKPSRDCQDETKNILRSQA